MSSLHIAFHLLIMREEKEIIKLDRKAGYCSPELCESAAAVLGERMEPAAMHVHGGGEKLWDVGTG